MKVRTGHVLLVLTMSYFQLLYDLTFFFSNVDCGYYVTVVANFFQLSCGIGSSLVSNWIAFIALYIILYRQKFNIFDYYTHILASCVLPGLVDAIIYLVAVCPADSQDDALLDFSILDYYYYTRLASIALNFIFVFLAFYKIDLMSSKTNNKSDQEMAIRTLARRLIFYPVVQAIGRSGYAWYEFEYGVNIDVDDPTQEQFASLIFLTIITPMVSIGYLIIFLVMQPRAYLEFKRMIFCKEYDEPIENSTKGDDEVSQNRDTLSYYTDRFESSASSEDQSPDTAKPGSDVIGTPVNNKRSSATFAAYNDEELLNFIASKQKRFSSRGSGLATTNKQPGRPSMFRGSLTDIFNSLTNAFNSSSTKQRESAIEFPTRQSELTSGTQDRFEIKNPLRNDVERTDRLQTISSATQSTNISSGRTTKLVLSDDYQAPQVPRVSERSESNHDSYKFPRDPSDFLADARDSVDDYYYHQQQLSDLIRDSSHA
jgi:hypothetical protein